MVQRPIAAGMYVGATPTVRTTTGTFRIPFIPLVDATDIKVAFQNFYNNGSGTAPFLNDIDPATTLTGLQASLEVGGVVLAYFTFLGQSTFNLLPGQQLESDPLPIEIPAGSAAAIRVFMPASQSWYANHFSGQALSGGGGFVATTNLCAPGSGAVADTPSTNMFAPSMISGTHMDTQRPIVLIAGDSIAHGHGEMGYIVFNSQAVNVNTVNSGGGGFITRACLAAGIPTIQTAIPGDKVSVFSTVVGRIRRLVAVNQASTVICEAGINDLTAGDPLGTVQANMIKVWRLFSRRGLRVFQTTITPVSTSTDGWMTVANQTKGAQDSVRVPLNEWIRDGAPLTPGTFTPLPFGTGGTQVLRAGQAGHPLFAHLPVASQVESSRNSGLWQAPANQRVITDAAITSASTTLNSAAQAAFTSADVGRKVAIPGAGASGATLFAVIGVVYSAISCALTVAASTTVSAATATICDNNTLDGVHPGNGVAAQMATAIDTNLFI